MQLSVVELYSKSFFNSCSVEFRSKIKDEVIAFLDAYSHSFLLRDFLNKNLISSKLKLDFLHSLGLHGILNNLFSLLHENSRLGFLCPILEKFLVKVRYDEGEMDAVVISASLLSKENIHVVSEALRVYYDKKKVSVVNVVDVKVLGGIIVRVGYLSFDFSVLRKIEDLSKMSIEAFNE